MINLSYRFDQDSSSLEIAGIPDVLNGDSEDTIGILSSWKLKIIGAPLLEGEKEHLENLMQVIFQYSRSYISGIRKTFISNKKIVTISPFGISHKLLLKSTKKGVEQEHSFRSIHPTYKIKVLFCNNCTLVFLSDFSLGNEESNRKSSMHNFKKPNSIAYKQYFNQLSKVPSSKNTI